MHHLSKRHGLLVNASPVQKMWSIIWFPFPCLTVTLLLVSIFSASFCNNKVLLSPEVTPDKTVRIYLALIYVFASKLLQIFFMALSRPDLEPTQIPLACSFHIFFLKSNYLVLYRDSVVKEQAFSTCTSFSTLLCIPMNQWNLDSSFCIKCS